LTFASCVFQELEAPSGSMSLEDSSRRAKVIANSVPFSFLKDMAVALVGEAEVLALLVGVEMEHPGTQKHRFKQDSEVCLRAVAAGVARICTGSPGISGHARRLVLPKTA
jgi:hypothetical protein